MRRVLVIAFVLCAGPAHAQEISATASPDPVRWPEDRSVTWRVKVRTAEAKTLTLSLQPRSRSPEQLGVPGFDIGSLNTNEIRLEGPGSFRLGATTHGDPCWAFTSSLPAYGLRHQHSWPANSFQEVRLELPASSESTLVVPMYVAGAAPWAGSSHGLAVSIVDEATGGQDRRVDARVPVQGPTGLPIAFNVEPGAVTPICQKDAPDHMAGTEMVIRGHTDSRAAGDHLTIMAGAPGDTEAKEIGKALVASDGTFGFSGWRPEQPGLHAVAVLYRSQRPELADDFAPPLAFRIREREARPEHPAPESPPPESPAPESRAPGLPEIAGRPRTRTKTALRLRCTATTRCVGIARMRRGGRSLGSARYAIAPGAEAVVRLPLPARERRLLRRRGRLAVEVRLAPAAGTVVVHRVTLRR